ncbi:hypothetical protein QQP08_012595, partial [Theobroma cacao]
KNDVVGKDNIGVDHNESNKVDVNEDIDVVYGPQDHETMNNLDVEVDDEDNNVVIRNDLKSRHTLLVDVECLSESEYGHTSDDECDRVSIEKEDQENESECVNSDDLRYYSNDVQSNDKILTRKKCLGSKCDPNCVISI